LLVFFFAFAALLLDFTFPSQFLLCVFIRAPFYHSVTWCFIFLCLFLAALFRTFRFTCYFCVCLLIFIRSVLWLRFLVFCFFVYLCPCAT
jgi:hypothetical protein